ncbi:MAG: hypothetical protein SCK29_00320 [Bacillota bacterium]|nr:hypothetical protein [Bacillota bacterium]MDW7682545.1 hypothetical protein [Bacillota bacterium]
MGRRGKFPDVLAYHIAETFSLQEQEDYVLRITRTSSPKSDGSGPLRIVRQRVVGDGTVLELTVTAEDWGKEV